MRSPRPVLIYSYILVWDSVVTTHARKYNPYKMSDSRSIRFEILSEASYVQRLNKRPTDFAVGLSMRIPMRKFRVGHYVRRHVSLKELQLNRMNPSIRASAKRMTRGSFLCSFGLYSVRSWKWHESNGNRKTQISNGCILATADSSDNKEKTLPK